MQVSHSPHRLQNKKFEAKNPSFYSTSDTTFTYTNPAEEVKEWSNLLGVGFTKIGINTKFYSNDL
jgi:hypothetical protein